VVPAVEDPPLAVVVPADLRVVPRGDEAAVMLPAEPEVPDARDAPRAGVVPADQDHERVTPVVPGAPVGEEVVHPVQHGALAAGVVVAHPAPQPVPHPSITFCPLGMTIPSIVWMRRTRTVTWPEGIGDSTVAISRPARSRSASAVISPPFLIARSASIESMRSF